mgnify:CR=1 FL=1
MLSKSHSLLWLENIDVKCEKVLEWLIDFGLLFSLLGLSLFIVEDLDVVLGIYLGSIYTTWGQVIQRLSSLVVLSGVSPLLHELDCCLL